MLMSPVALISRDEIAFIAIPTQVGKNWGDFQNYIASSNWIRSPDHTIVLDFIIKYPLMLYAE